MGTYFTQYEFDDAEKKVDNALKPFYKPFEDLGITVNYVPDCDNPADNFCELYYGNYLVGYLSPEVEYYDEENVLAEDDDPFSYDTDTYYDFDEIEVRITIYDTLDHDSTNYYPQSNNDLDKAVDAAKNYIVLVKNEQIKKRENKLKQDF